MNAASEHLSVRRIRSDAGEGERAGFPELRVAIEAFARLDIDLSHVV
ncbi:hypothetical protein [Pandoraea terrae]|nr:hypothetical protein [Pandoraea terrae]